MLALYSPLTQTLFGTLFTWGMTALGSVGCLLHYSPINSVMLAASYWSLLSPAEEMAHSDGYGNLSFVPLAIGLLLGSYFVFLADKYGPVTSLSDFVIIAANQSLPHHIDNDHQIMTNNNRTNHSGEASVTQRKQYNPSAAGANVTDAPGKALSTNVSRRLVLMMIAITIHNIPEGLAVGVAFGAVGQSKAATTQKAMNLALGIGIQNFPEGLAVSLPLKAAGMSLSRSVWYGQLSGLVEPVAGVIGCVAVQLISPILPYALSFAAGAMIFVVLDDIMPESQAMGNGQLASISAIFGFVVMMCLDIGLG